MALKSLSSIETGGTVSGSNIVNNTQKINSVTIGTGDIVIDAEKIPMGSSDSTSVSAKITNIDNAAVHKAGDETITGAKTFNSGLKIAGNDLSYKIAGTGSGQNDLSIENNIGDSILSVSATKLIKIGSESYSDVELGYDVDDDAKNKEITTAKWVINNAVPVGTIITSVSKTEPKGYLLCDGREVSRNQYSKLFGVIGVDYGVGDGKDTFNLPNLSDNRFIEYSSTASEIGDLKDPALPNITGTVKGPGVIVETSGAFTMPTQDYAEYSDDSPDGGNNRYMKFDASNCSSVYKNDVTTVQPKSIVLMAYIKY